MKVVRIPAERVFVRDEVIFHSGFSWEKLDKSNSRENLNLFSHTQTPKTSWVSLFGSCGQRFPENLTRTPERRPLRLETIISSYFGIIGQFIACEISELFPAFRSRSLSRLPQNTHGTFSIQKSCFFTDETPVCMDTWMLGSCTENGCEGEEPVTGFDPKVKCMYSIVVCTTAC